MHSGHLTQAGMMYFLFSTGNRYCLSCCFFLFIFFGVALDTLVTVNENPTGPYDSTYFIVLGPVIPCCGVDALR